MVLGILILKYHLNLNLLNVFPWVNIMKKNSKAKVQDNSLTTYTKILNSLRSAVSGNYSTVIQKEKSAVVLAYDWDYYLINNTGVEATLVAAIFLLNEILIEAVQKNMLESCREKHWVVTQVQSSLKRAFPLTFWGGFLCASNYR